MVSLTSDEGNPVFQSKVGSVPPGVQLHPVPIFCPATQRLLVTLSTNLSEYDITNKMSYFFDSSIYGYIFIKNAELSTIVYVDLIIYITISDSCKNDDDSH